MRNHRRAALAALSAVFILAGLVGTADAQKQTTTTATTNGPAGLAAEAKEAVANPNAKLQMYEAVVDGATLEQLTNEGYDIASTEQIQGGFRIVLVLYPWERKGLEKQGIELSVWTNEEGLTATQLAAEQFSTGFKVWRDYDDPDDGIEAYLQDLDADDNASGRDILELIDIGDTLGTDQGGVPRDIYAVRLTANESGSADGSKPAVLYSSMIHAREWITVEVNRRLLDWFIKGWQEEKPEVVNILNTTELWFILVQNPDGYQWTFEPEGDRLWRKNLRDNDPDGSGPMNPDGQITTLDGVDNNRNFAEHWKFDDEGSASIVTDQTYRGTAPASEPETQALIEALELSQPEFHITYHSFGELLLYTFGFQVNTPSADDPIYVAWAGTDKKPAVTGYDPGVGADLYTTNGEQTDYVHAAHDALSITPELGDGTHDDGFIFPDSEGEVQREFLINLDFAVAAAKSAVDPDDPVSPVKIETEPFYLNVGGIDPQKSFNPMSDFTFAHSYNGSSQPVRVLARRDLDNDGDPDPVSMKYQIGSGAVQTVSTSEWNGGDRYGGPGDVYYHVMQGTVTGAPAGSDVTVWFEGAGQTSDSFTFHVEKATANEVLILADTDYTGPSNFPPYTPADGTPPFLAPYEQALTANGYTSDVYDVDALGAAPDHLGVLGHYDAVVWYTGNDLLSRVPGQPGGTGAETQANTMMLEVRAFLNEGGKLMFTGRHAGWQFANAFDYNPVTTPPFCDNVDQTVDDDCLFLSDDFLQYWLGAYLFVEDGGTDINNPDITSDDVPFTVSGADDPYDDATSDPWTINQTFAQSREATTQSFITTSSILKVSDFPQFNSTAPAVWNTGISGPFQPHNNSTYYAYSQRADIRYQRLMNTFTPTAGDSELSFFTSYDTEPEWDFLFVEAHTVGQEDWVTLPVANITSSDTGMSCPEGWFELHPWLERYQGADCSGTGTSGAWNATSGRSSGWEEWTVDLSGVAPAGGQVEVSISYAQDWAVQGLGVWIDDVNGPGTAGDTGFEDGTLGTWTIGDPTAIGSDINALDWIVTGDVGFTEGAMTSMDPPAPGANQYGADFKTLYLGFAFENVQGADAREEIIGDAIAYLTS
jgi:Zinc carboxypeptidase